MCDTLVIVFPGRVLFAKNSDRDPNEAQRLEWHPRRRHAPGSSLRCTWMDIPQAPETKAVLISRPFWMWGAEMGANECGVVIGNEAVFTNQTHASHGLTGMDMLRLALERSESAQDACSILIELLDRFGQGGGCGYERRSLTYHNSFLVADAGGAVVLETAGKKWAVENVFGVRAISNGLTIPDFAQQYADPIRGRIAACGIRAGRTAALAQDVLNARDMFALLRDHGEGNDTPHYGLFTGGMNAPCMHAGGLLATAQTTASWVSELSRNGARHWVTATAAPCISLFKEVHLAEPIAETGLPGAFPDASLWWKHERLHRIIMGDADLTRGVRAELQGLERTAWNDAMPSRRLFQEHHVFLDRRLEALKESTLPDRRPLWVRNYWRRRNRWAGLDGCGESAAKSRPVP